MEINVPAMVMRLVLGVVVGVLWLWWFWVYILDGCAKFTEGVCGIGRYCGLCVS